MNQPSAKPPKILDVLHRNGLKVFSKPYELNIIGVRSSSNISNKFDDVMYVCYNSGNNMWMQHRFAITTDPGLHFLNKPMNSAGTAILKDGQFINAYQLGLHRGKYKALVQRKALTVYRSKNNSRNIDGKHGSKQTGLFGINIHHASGNGTSADVDRWSAGCQVIANINNFKTLIGLAEHHAKLYGNQFTYTLLDYRIDGYVPEPIEQNHSSPVVTKPKEDDIPAANLPSHEKTKSKAPLLLIGLLATVGIGSTIYYYATTNNKPKNESENKTN
jgi:hypothetical protein